jgi:hypothetical protein
MRAPAAAQAGVDEHRFLRPPGRRALRLDDRAERGAAQSRAVRAGLSPAQYLDPARLASRAQGLAPGNEVALRINFDAGRVKAIGYRLYLFFPQ